LSNSTSQQDEQTDTPSVETDASSTGWFQKIIEERGMFSNFLSFPQDKAPWFVTILLIAVAYYLSFWVRLEWIDFAQAHYENDKGEIVYFHPEMVKDGVALPNTHDSFYFGSILQKANLGMHQNNNLIPSVWLNGMITFLPYLLLKIFPSLGIEPLLLWLPVYIAGLVCIPIVLIGRLYGSHAWGFFAACLAGVTHSYYNRTLAGYYDTDMFSITVPAFALYFLLSASRRQSLNFALAGAVTLYLYRFFYTSGMAITGALVLAFIGYRIGLLILDFFFSHKKNIKTTLSSPASVFSFQSIFLISFTGYSETWAHGLSIENNPERFFLGLAILVVSRIVFKFVEIRDHTKEKSGEKVEQVLSVAKGKKFVIPFFSLPIFCMGMLCFSVLDGNYRSKIFSKLDRYVSAGKGVAMQSLNKEKGYSLSYLDVFSTVREASGIPKAVVRNRILADSPSCSCPRCLPASEKEDAIIIPTAIFGLFGVILLMLRYWEFCLAVPFLAIAYYCFEGAVGLRFTVHVGNIASLGIVFLILCIFSLIVRKIFGNERANNSNLVAKTSWAVSILTGGLVIFLLRPNIQHAQNYHSHVVYPTKTIEVLNKLNEVSQPDDFVVTWWDYGSGCWFYGNARTFTSPAHQTFDNFLTSEILRSRDPDRAINLARLKTETFLDIQKKRELGESTYSTAVQAIFKDGKPDLAFYQGVLHDLEKGTYPLPPKTQDIFLFLPYEILRIFPTILSFSSRNLYFSDGQAAQSNASREPPMKVLRNGRREGFAFKFDEGFRFDQQGNLRLEADQSGVVPYAQLWTTSGISGDAARIVPSISVDGFNILSKPDSRSSRALLYVEKTKDLVILSSIALNSTFAKRFLLDKFDEQVFAHPIFEKGVNPVRQPFMTQADWVSSLPNGVSLNMRGGYRVDANLQTLKAKVPGVKDPVPFAFHRRMHDEKSGKLIKMPSQQKETPQFHLIQTNLPIFAGGRSYTVPSGGKTVSQIAASNGLSSAMLAHHLDTYADELVSGGQIVEIPARGYQMSQAWFFMDQEVFESILVQGFLMEELASDLFEKVYSTPWGKVYKIVK
jgi:dolichyl-diphosphooligosaccharide--protein glycosyltransferase/undecaprenyl-diphosphooligosaccharide--protein glycosyltransferase